MVVSTVVVEAVEAVANVSYVSVMVGATSLEALDEIAVKDSVEAWFKDAVEDWVEASFEDAGVTVEVEECTDVSSA